MTAEDKIKEAMEKLSEVIHENIDLCDEKWYRLILQAQDKLNLSLKELERNKNG